MITVSFVFLTGIKRSIFHHARLSGSLDNGSDVPMTEIIKECGCPLPAARQDHEKCYRLMFSRYLGTQKFYCGGAPVIRFAAWAPNAQSVEVVFGRTDNGYIADDGAGIDPVMPSLSLIGNREGYGKAHPAASVVQRSVSGRLHYRIRCAPAATRLVEGDLQQRLVTIGRNQRGQLQCGCPVYVGPNRAAPAGNRICRATTDLTGDAVSCKDRRGLVTRIRQD